MDAKILGGGSVFLVRPLSEEARTWIEENVGGETTWFGDSLAVEHRYIQQLVEGMQNAGLEVG